MKIYFTKNKMRSINCFVIALLMANLAISQDAFTLQQAIDYAKENHNNVKNDILEIADAEGNIKEFTAIGMPKLNGSVQLQHFLNIPTSIIPSGSFFAGDPDLGIPPNPSEDLEVQFGVKNNLTASLSADFLLFDGSFFIGLKASRVFKDLVAKQANITKSELAHDVAKAYLGVAVAFKNLEILDKNITNLEDTYGEMRATYEAGFIEKLDLDRLQLSINNLKLEQQRVTSMSELSKNVLKFSMGYPLENPIEISESMEDLSISEYESTSFTSIAPNFDNRAEYAALKVGDQLNELNIKRLEFQYLPVLRGFASYAQVLQGNQLTGAPWFPTTLVGLTLDVPIFDGFDKKSKLHRAKIERDQHLIAIDNLEDAITLEVDNAKLSFTNAVSVVESSRANLMLAQDIYDTAQIKYREGVGTSLEITQAERDLYAAQGEQIQAEYNMLIAKVDLEKALGNL